MSRRSSPSFAVGGVSWLDHLGRPGDATIRPPEGGWRCFHCDMRFTHWRAAMRHFGQPSSKRLALCDPFQSAIAAAISDPGATEGYKGDRSLTAWQTAAVMRLLADGELKARSVRFRLAAAEADLDGLDGGLADRAHDSIVAALRVMGTDSLSAYREAVAAMEHLADETAGLLDGVGWVFHNDGSGEEYSRNHPVDSGEVIDATDIRRSTAQEDLLWNALQTAHHVLSLPTAAAQ